MMQTRPNNWTQCRREIVDLIANPCTMSNLSDTGEAVVVVGPTVVLSNRNELRGQRSGTSQEVGTQPMCQMWGILFTMGRRQGQESINSAGVKVVCLLGLLAPHLSSATNAHNSFYLVERLRGKQHNDLYLRGYYDLLDKSELSWLDQWRKFKGDEVALQIVDGPNEKDCRLWHHIFPAFLQSCVKHSGAALSVFRESIVVVVSQYHPSISQVLALACLRALPPHAIHRREMGPN